MSDQLAETALPTPPPEPGTQVSEEPIRRSPWRRLLRRPGFIIPGAVIVLLALMSIFPQVFAGFFGHADPRVCDLSSSGLGPVSGHPFGFDLQGCDVYANVVYGTRTSLSIGVLTTALSLLVAVVIGTLAGFYGGWADAVISRLTDVFLGFPFLLGSIVVLNSIGRPSVLSVSAVLALFGWPVMARLVRASVKSVRQMEYVLAARTMGLSTPRILLRYVLPNSLSPVIVVGTITVGGVIVAESSLTFLGVGLTSPVISWSLQLSAASGQFQNSPHLLIFPALFLAATVLSIITLGDTLRTALDPKRQQLGGSDPTAHPRASPNNDREIDMTAQSADSTTTTEPVIDETEQARRGFAEDFGLIWENNGSPRMEGRVIGYLMIMAQPYLSSADLCVVLQASAGSMSMTTRRLAEMGFIRRHVIPGDRNHYFRADADIWGSWLAGERPYLDRQRIAIERGLAIVADSDDDGDIRATERLQNGRDYMIWLATYHRKMLADWQAYKTERDAQAPGKRRATPTNEH